MRPVVEALPRGQNRLGSFNAHRNARFDKVTYLPQLTDQGAPASGTSPKESRIIPFFIQRIQLLECFGRKDVFFDGNVDCHLYTSDAGEERSSVDLGGRCIILKRLHILHGYKRLVSTCTFR